MAKLSDLFGRKGEPGALVPRPSARGNGGGHISIENLSDIGSRMDEENEELRSLLTDTGLKIGELGQLKQAFDKLVAPFNATLRAVEQEKSQTT
jgi:crescentin